MRLVKSLMGILAVGIATVATPALAEYPEKPIQVVVPVGTGGDTDYNARVFSKYLQEELGEALPVVNVPGAGGTIGARQVMTADPDGYTVMFYHAGLLVSTASGMADFSWKDFKLAAIAGREGGQLLVVRGDAPWKSMEDLAKAVKADPGNISLTANIGATTYLISQLLSKEGLDFNLVDVGGSGNRLTAVLGGNVDVSQNAYAQVRDYVANGELRALASVSEEPIIGAPEIPLLKDMGYDVAFQFNWFYAFPKGTPQDVVDTFATAVENVSKNPDYAAEIRAYAQEPVVMTGDEAVNRMEELETTVDSVKLQ